MKPDKPNDIARGKPAKKTETPTKARVPWKRVASWE